jgi:hypothetical protein
MSTPAGNIIKLAPTLSPRERAKILISDYYNFITTGNSVINEAERQALWNFKTSQAWREYYTLVTTYKWAHIIWYGQIEKMGLASLFINGHLNTLVRLEDILPAETLLDDPQVFGLPYYLYISLRSLFEYREAIVKLEAELDLLPLFDPKTYETIRQYWDTSEEAVNYHRDLLLVILELESSTNKESDKNVNPDEIVAPIKVRDEAVANLVKELKALVASEVKKNC